MSQTLIAVSVAVLSQLSNTVLTTSAFTYLLSKVMSFDNLQSAYVLPSRSNVQVNLLTPRAGTKESTLLFWLVSVITDAVVELDHLPVTSLSAGSLAVSTTSSVSDLQITSSIVSMEGVPGYMLVIVTASVLALSCTHAGPSLGVTVHTRLNLPPWSPAKVAVVLGDEASLSLIVTPVAVHSPVYSTLLPGNEPLMLIALFSGLPVASKVGQNLVSLASAVGL